jgi:hypothetical protein
MGGAVMGVDGFAHNLIGLLPSNQPSNIKIMTFFT